MLRRDDYQCQVCGELDASEVLVHHRSPGARSRKQMITLCRRCHPRIHFTARPSFAFARHRRLYALWRELHPRQPEQRPLLLLAPASAEQPDLFEVSK